MSDDGKESEPSMEEILASIRRILAEDEGAASAAPGNNSTSDVLELTEAIADDGTVRRIAPPGIAAGTAAEARVAPAAPRVAGGAGAEPLVSVTASKLAAAAFARLADAPREPRRDAEPSLAAPERSLEDVVRDMLRPLLQGWLDKNLPGLVERLVRAEIARVAGDSRRP